MHRDTAISKSCSISNPSRNEAANLTHYILDLNVVAAVQLDQGPMNTSQLRMQVIVSAVQGNDRVNGFGGVQGLP